MNRLLSLWSSQQLDHRLSYEIVTKRHFMRQRRLPIHSVRPRMIRGLSLSAMVSPFSHPDSPENPSAAELPPVTSLQRTLSAILIISMLIPPGAVYSAPSSQPSLISFAPSPHRSAASAARASCSSRETPPSGRTPGGRRPDQPWLRNPLGRSARGISSSR